jgi:phosphoglycerate dehydrogenase-like enzyme
MRILFAAPATAWSSIFTAIRSQLPEHRVETTEHLTIESLQGVDVLIPTMCTVTKGLLEGSEQLRLIQQCGSGLELVDLDAARTLNIRVANVPTSISGSADSAAELGIYFMIGVSRNVRDMTRNLASGRMGEPIGKTLSGATAGIIGLGGIGKALVKRLKAFDVRLIGIKRHSRQECMRELGMEWVGGPRDLHRLLSLSDYVFLCVPLTPETRHMMDSKAFATIKPGAFLVNLARGGLVDRNAFEEALESGRVAGAGLDVFWEEPPDPHDPVFQYNVMATPHIAVATEASVSGVVRVVVQNIKRVEKGQEPQFRIV